MVSLPYACHHISASFSVLVHVCVKSVSTDNNSQQLVKACPSNVLHSSSIPYSGINWRGENLAKMAKIEYWHVII